MLPPPAPTADPSSSLPFPPHFPAATTNTNTASTTSTATTTAAAAAVAAAAGDQSSNTADSEDGGGGLLRDAPQPHPLQQQPPQQQPPPAPACRRPRLLVCHDMQGGYLQDRLVQGGDDPGGFRLWHWSSMDVFVYFSHHTVTLPPPGWVAAAHRNGVKVLGTFITEWAAGRDICCRLFASPAAARAAADSLVRLAAHGGFEGWLVNIENGLPRALLGNLRHFLAHLRAGMRAVVGPHAMVVWYDAITTEGRLVWQNALTPLNAPFFDAADALFVNYGWRREGLRGVAEAAGSRAAEVYMGVDVFGRGTYGGGQFNCPQALAAARCAGLSAALFAPGWVWEEFGRSGFEARQEAFWGGIQSCWPPSRPQLQLLPLVTCFNGGAGRGVWLEGERVSCAPWYQLAAQDTLPHTTPCSASATTATSSPATHPQQQGPHASSSSSSPPPSPSLLVRPTQQVAFCGGSCLALSLAPPPAPASTPAPAPPAPAPAAAFWTHQLYSAALPVPASGLDVSYTVAGCGASRVALLLRLAGSSSAVAAAAAAAATASMVTASTATAPAVAAVPAVAGAGCSGGGGAGVVVGCWGAGDVEVVEQLRRAGFTCISCYSAPTGATTCPLPDAGSSSTAPSTTSTSTTSSSSCMPSTTTASGSAVPAGLPWITCGAHLPRSLLAACMAAGGGGDGGGGGGAEGCVVTSVGLVCYLAGSGGGGGGGGGGGAGRAGAPVARVAEGGGLPALKAFLGRLVLREHRPATQPPAPLQPAHTVTTASSTKAARDPTQPHLPASTTSTTTTATHSPLYPSPPLPGVLAAPPPSPPPASPPLAGARCFRVHWSRPAGRNAAAGGNSGRGSSAVQATIPATGVRTVAGKVADAAVSAAGTVAAAAAAVAAAAAAAAATTGLADASEADLGDPRVSGELVEANEEDEDEAGADEEVETAEAGGTNGEEEEEDDGWERATGGISESPVKLRAPGAAATATGGATAAAPAAESPVATAVAAASSAVLEHSEGSEDADDAASGAGSEGEEGEEGGCRLLTCELSWQPQFDEWGQPRHRCYQVWAHFSAEELTVVGRSDVHGDQGVAGAADVATAERAGAWELLPAPSWSCSAVWAGEAFVGRYRLVQLEVPGWARRVALGVQSVGWQAGEVGGRQCVAWLGVPRGA
ncbi:hypothetical protein Agub_g9088 [Astrephomene gubernaculifera]|uniref:Cytosolic endo-beta-N-acetylglucosaminidase TIM barrel domain-containing protein n=1 Tax=Astrephomene gubernaculifera TaxID=47775 RepID=A0AAD3HNT2_9CHLO|nr:hypothetical protein Agub_g9088 [Astrephomene gubernaculifera]